MRSARDMGEGASPFALAAYRMMMSNTRKAVLNWDEDGKAIVIKKKAEVVDVLSQHFGGNSTWLWLRNQLQNHGFRMSSGKCAAERDWLLFRHRGFQRGERHMLGNVHCPKAGCKFCKSLAWPRPREGATKRGRSKQASLATQNDRPAATTPTSKRAKRQSTSSTGKGKSSDTNTNTNTGQTRGGSRGRIKSKSTGTSTGTGKGKGKGKSSDADTGDDIACEVCGSTADELDGLPMLLCDNCNCGFHMRCVGLHGPPPEGEWFCIACLHVLRQRGQVDAQGRRLTPELLASMRRPAALLSSDEDDDDDSGVDSDDEAHEGVHVQSQGQGQSNKRSSGATVADRSKVASAALTGASQEVERMGGATPAVAPGRAHSAGHDGAQIYFQAFGSTSRTSNRTLRGIKMPGYQQVAQLLGGEKKHPVELAMLRVACERHFDLWRSQLRAGFNLILYGFGSKKKVAEEFASKMLHDGDLVVVTGYASSASAKQIANTITQHVLESGLRFSSLSDQCHYIAAAYASANDGAGCSAGTSGSGDAGFTADEDRHDGAAGGRRPRLYIVVHNIDGVNLRSSHVQQALSVLAAADRVHVVATVDHVNAPLLWDQEVAQRFNWVWHDASTYEPYLSEVAYEAPVVGMSAEMAARGVGFVLRSLTPNHRHILKLLAQQQASGAGGGGVGFQEFNQLCQDQMLVNNATALRHHMTELKDHALVQERRTSDGKDTLIIPEDKLAPIIAQLDAKSDGSSNSNISSS